MACPYFLPAERLPWPKWPGKLRPPLGDLYAGVCRAGSEPFLPSGRLLVDCCNSGYAGAECNRFSNNDGPDAVRFGLSADDGQTVEIAYAVERGHLPLRHGRLRYCRVSKRLTEKEFTQKNSPHVSHPVTGEAVGEKSTFSGFGGFSSDQLLEGQAQAYLASYLRSKGEELVLK
jgi:hypothetical protein